MADLHKSRRWIVIGGVVVAVLLLAALVAGPLLASKVKRDLARSLAEATHSTASIGSVSVWFTTDARITAGNIALRYGGRTDVPPLIQLQRLTIHTGIFGLFGTKKHFSLVKLEGLQVDIPPDRNKGKGAGNDSNQLETRIDELISEGAVLRIEPNAPGKEALIFGVPFLHLNPAGRDVTMRYTVDVRNPKPPGLVHSSGTVGPWNSEPGLLPVSGAYEFRNADLAAFNDIGGILNSNGKFTGHLNQIEITGTAEIAGFKLRIGEHPVAVHADYLATVNGLNGNTLLHPVTLHFLHSTIVASGGVLSEPGEQGKTVTLDAVVRPGRIDDFLRLTTKPKEPFMSGPTSMRARIIVPPEHRPFLDKVRVSGHATIGASRYNRPTVQVNVDRLSDRAEGDPEGNSLSAVNSEIDGECTVTGAIVHASSMSFQVPGALAHVHGTYALRSHVLNFTGTLRTAAKASDTVTGWKSALLKVVDPFLKRRNAGAEIPIQVTGTQEHPNFGVRKKL